MTELRKQFEVLPEIADKIHTVQFNEQFNTYHAAMVNSSTSVKFIQGAWYAFQEQQKKIDGFVGIIRDAYMSDGNSSVEIVYDKIQELLK